MEAGAGGLSHHSATCVFAQREEHWGARKAALRGWFSIKLVLTDVFLSPYSDIIAIFNSAELGCFYIKTEYDGQ